MPDDVRRGTTQDLEGLLRTLALAGAATLIGALLVAALGTLTHTLAPGYGSTLRFLVAVLVVTAPYADLLERRTKRLRRIPIEKRLGFAPRDTTWPQRSS
jgi:hypothetical protein